MDGIEFIRHLGKLESKASVILASAVGTGVLASVEAMAAAYGVHLLGVLEKPVTPEKLKALLARHRLRPGPAVPRPAQQDYPADAIAHGLRDKQFEPFFQPKVEFSSGRVTGFEALARWRHPRDGIVTPSAFVPAMEAGSLMDELTWCILQKAADACSAWRHRSGLDLCVSVNLSVHTLADPGFADQVRALTDAAHLQPCHLMFEVTESVAISLAAGSVLENLSRLRMNGYGLAIDDFGTGYSSLQQLSLVPFTELKIDQYFVRSAARQGSSMIMLRSSLDMARKLKLVSVAEGVESQQEWDLLKELGCDLAQGYFVARPMETSRVADWTMKWNARQRSRDRTT
jgi:EAL domain-containing protein (putative c-di-GMP-specific phosphodiesterase class I)